MKPLPKIPELVLGVSQTYRDVSSSDGLGGVLVEEHAVCGRDHVLTGYQGPATELASVGQESCHPGVFVLLG